jgi:pyrimidine-nucleoside phosphorylase
MRPQEVIRKKRDKGELTRAEIRAFVRGVASGAWADYQSSALLMAIYLNGMGDDERQSLAEEMLLSGEVLNFSDIAQPKVDKHSTGGVGDKTSLVIAPIVASAGCAVPMISGRGLGHTGGTLDKLEAIPGYRVNLDLSEFRAILRRIGFAMIGQTEEIAPADRKLYALRDVTATIESLPLIAASIMSKKLAEGLDGLVLDVKSGDGAFMKSKNDARQLADALVQIGTGAGVNTIALVTDMSQPLGYAVGNRLEVIECFEILRGRGPRDLTELCIELSAQMIVAGGARSACIEDARETARRKLEGGEAFEKFRESIEAQGGNRRTMDDYSLMPVAAHSEELLADEDGFIARIDAEATGRASMLLGAGRVRAEDRIDPAVGIVLNKKIGDYVEKREPLARIHYNADARLGEARKMLREAFHLAQEKPASTPLVIETLTGKN